MTRQDAGLHRGCSFAVAASIFFGGPSLAIAADAADVRIAWWRVALGFCLSVALALGAIYVLWSRHQGRGLRWPRPGLKGAWGILQAPSRRMRLVETLRLNNHVHLCLIHYEDTELAVAAGPQGGSLVYMRPMPSRPSAADLIDEPTP